VNGLIYGVESKYHTNGEISVNVVVAANQLEQEEIEAEYFANGNTSNYQLTDVDKTIIYKNIIRLFTCFAFPESIVFPTILILVYFILSATFFNILPDDLTLINQMVRLND
jgi:hypothetical protein